MSFFSAVFVCFSKFVTFEGRACRTEFWWFIVFNFAVGVALSQLSALPGSMRILYAIIILPPCLAVTARRLHDTNRSGWWMLFYLGPILLLAFLPIVSATGGNVFAALILIITFSIVGAVSLVLAMAKRGEIGPNRFGLDPITGSPEQVF